MLVLAKEQKSTFFEDHADEILRDKNITKAQFAKAMGVAPQNINKLFGTKNALTLSNIANYLSIPLKVLIFGPQNEETDIHGCIYVDGEPNLIYCKEDLSTLLSKLN